MNSEQDWSQLRITTLGGLWLERGGEPLPAFSTQNARALFAYLVTFRHRPHPRAVLAGLLWPEAPEERARRYLSDALWRLRRVVGDAWVLAEEDALAFNVAGDYWLDAEVFEAQVARAKRSTPDMDGLKLAIELYRGEFLEGFYDDWALRERERLHLDYLGALERLLLWHSDREENAKALEYGQRLVAADPLRDTAHRLVMLLYQRLGRYHAALQQFEACRRILRDELDVDPLPETVRLAAEIRESAYPTRTPFDDFGSAPLVGRHAERADLLAHLDATVAGRGGVVLIEGEPGVGKTRLVEEAAMGAAWRGFQVLRGTCRDAPYAPLVEALERGLTPLRAGQLARLVEPNLLAALVPLFPALGDMLSLPALPSLDPAGEKTRLHRALIDCIVALGQIAPYALIVEDWQRMDPATLEIVPLFAECLPGSRVLLIGTARGGELRDRPDVWQQVLALDHAGILKHQRLERLTIAESRELLRGLLGSSLPSALASSPPTTDLSERIYASAQGNPLYTIEWVKALVESGQLRRGSTGVWSFHGDASWQPPSAVLRVIAARLEQLPAAERRLLEGAAVLGGPFGFDLWRAVTGADSKALLAGSDELLRRQFIVETDTGYRFSHDLIRQAAYDYLDPAARRRWHYQAGLALEAQSPDSVEALADHFEQAGNGEQAVRYHCRAGERARALYANQSARRHFTRAVTLGASLDAAQMEGEIAHALCQRAEIFSMLGDRDAAERDYAAAVDLLDSSEADQVCRAEALRGLGWTRGYYQEQREEGLALLAQARALYQAAADVPGVVQCLAQAGHILGEASRWDEAVVLYREGQSLARKVGDRAGLARVLLGSGVANLFRPNPAEAVADFAAAADLYDALGDTWNRSKCLANLGQARLHLPDMPGAVDAFRQAWTINEAIGAEAAQPFVLLGLSYASWRAGDLAAARRAVEEAIARQKRLDESGIDMALLLANLARVQASTGEIQAALEIARKTSDMVRQSYIPTAIWSLNCQAGLYLLLGALPQAEVRAFEALALARQIAYASGEAQAQQRLGQIALARGDRAAACERLSFAFRVARESGDWFEIGDVHLAMAEYWLAAGRPERALALARRTERKARAGGAALLQLEATVSLGWAWLAAGDAACAALLLAGVLAQAEECGLPILVWRAAEGLARAEPAQADRHLARAWDGIQQIASHIDDSALRHSFLALPAVRAIEADLDQVRRTQGVRRYVYLYRLDGASGVQVEVVWTIDAGEPDAALLAAEGKVALRRARLLRLVEEARAQDALPTQDDLARALGVTQRTIRSDLVALRQEGRQVRTWGSSS